MLADEWLMFDDDKVTPVQSEDILKLSGGGMELPHRLFINFVLIYEFCVSGDWHCAYVLLYGPRILEIDLSKPEASDAAEVNETVQSKTESPMES